MKRIGGLLAVGLLAVGLIRLTAVLWSRAGTFVAETWRSELEKAPDDRLEAIVARVTALGDDALPALADALGSSREAVAAAARQALWAEIDAWDSSPKRDVGATYARVAAALAERMDRYPSAVRQDAARVVNHILSRPLGDSASRVKLLAACKEVLRAQGAAPEEIEAAGLLQARIASSPAGAGSVATASAQGGERAGAAAGSGLTGITAPGPIIGPSLEAPGPASRTAQAKTPERPAKPRFLEEASSDADGKPGQGPSRLSSRPGRLNRADDTPRPPTTNEPRRLDPVQRLTHETADASARLAAGASRITGDVRAVARRLRDEDPVRAEQARKELRRRGFSEPELELAGRLIDPDPAVRKKLPRALLSTPGIDAGPWLLELCGDDDAEVRLEAFTLLATTGDPALIEPLRRRAQMDADERIQRLAERLDRPASSREKRR